MKVINSVFLKSSIFFLVTLSTIGCENVEPKITFDEYLNLVESYYVSDAIDCGESIYSVEQSTGIYSSPEVMSCIQSMQSNGMSAYGRFKRSTAENNPERTWISWTVHGGSAVQLTYIQEIFDASHEGPTGVDTCINPIIVNEVDPTPPLILECD